MKVTKIIDAVTVANSGNATSTVYTPREFPDQYATVVVTHSSTKLASGTTLTAALQGSMDNSVWFDIESMRNDDAAYQKGDGSAPSWTRAVPIMPYMRVRVSNTTGGTLTMNAWIVE